MAARGFLWSQWLIQDLANIFVYLPRELTAWGLVGAAALMLAIHAAIFSVVLAVGLPVVHARLYPGPPPSVTAEAGEGEGAVGETGGPAAVEVSGLVEGSAALSPSIRADSP